MHEEEEQEEEEEEGEEEEKRRVIRQRSMKRLAQESRAGSEHHKRDVYVSMQARERHMRREV